MTPLPETPPNAAPPLPTLMVQASAQAQLTPAQQRFNELLARIELLSGHIQRLEAWSDRHRYTHIQALRESVQQAQAHRKNLLLFLHERLQTADLTVQQQRMARGKLRSLIEQLADLAEVDVELVQDPARMRRADQRRVCGSHASGAPRSGTFAGVPAIRSAGCGGCAGGS